MLLTLSMFFNVFSHRFERMFVSKILNMSLFINILPCLKLKKFYCILGVPSLPLDELKSNYPTFNFIPIQPIYR